MKYLKIILAAFLLTSFLWMENDSLTTLHAAAAVNTAGIKGVNNPHIWWDSQAYSALEAIKKQGFNTVRIVWQTNGTAARLKQIIDRCKVLGLKPIPELHDVTGGSNAADIERMVNYWIGCKSILSNDLWINIANEWGPTGGTVWRDTYKNAISRIRAAGMTNPLVIDAPGWGQDSECIKAYGRELLSHDPQKNLIFSIHMYGNWNDPAKIRSELTTLKQRGLPVVVGEFGYNYQNGNNNLNCKVDVASLIATCKELGIGFLAWSWCGNNAENAWLDLTDNWGGLTAWGKLVVNAMNSTPANTPPTNDSNIIANFESNTESWSGSGISGGPWVTNEWKANGMYALKADIGLGKDKYFYLFKTGAFNFAAKSKLTVVVRHAPWGTFGTGIKAKLYVKSGSSWTWFDSGAVMVSSDNKGTTLSLNLEKTNRSDIKEYGVQFIAAPNSKGVSAIYVDCVTLQ
ncbi:MAG TPA: cellulase family glycosylhydrolase [Bacillota bacterium]|nr:cellulase family glycosylhydrolase [Bacillota bacterium]